MPGLPVAAGLHGTYFKRLKGRVEHKAVSPEPEHAKKHSFLECSQTIWGLALCCEKEKKKSRSSSSFFSFFFIFHRAKPVTAPPRSSLQRAPCKQKYSYKEEQIGTNNLLNLFLSWKDNLTNPSEVIIFSNLLLQGFTQNLWVKDKKTQASLLLGIFFLFVNNTGYK